MSACLLGDPVRYDGASKGLNDPRLAQWCALGWVLPLCPEVSGGLPTPRPAAEQQSDGRVLTQQGENVSQAFYLGAEVALAQAQRHGIRLALLKANSPSCGNRQVYDGRFQGRLISGEGVTASRLRQHGVQVFNENELAALAEALGWEA
ncbi:DUF523 domain-containing protein [Ferrimonas marina]|uniref:Uncharacterized conserved protein YbbK, DUF523 family n=1 Tax=Ferrimonas marina TaxID=299255 RepID=A0A1M5XTJ1_9GAMM|nr:DUF523 domain-containing protein [Ferrimonas marina]SHI03069.1 Uncharacterized conserved protein YbbK, DUF523 family [Ferrimonas marina]